MSQDEDEEGPALVAPREWPVVIELKHPITLAKERIATLEFRKGKLGDLDGIKPDGVPAVDQLLLIASRMCGQTVAALKKLEDEDAAPVLEIALSFFARCLGAGTPRKPK